jgi:hypothetical protein
MCQFKSALVLKNGDVIYSDWTDSHEDLIDMLELSDEGNGNFVRIEFVPKDNKYADAEFYALKIDQPDTPEWWTTALAEHTTDYMREIIKRMIIKTEKKCLVGGSYILDGAQIGRCIHANVIVMFGSSKVGEMRESSKVGEMWGSSKVDVMLESSKVDVMLESSKVGEDKREKKA